MLDKEIFEYKDFGCIKICLDDLMNSKNISTYELSTKSGIRFQTIQSLRFVAYLKKWFLLDVDRLYSYKDNENYILVDEEGKLANVHK